MSDEKLRHGPRGWEVKPESVNLLLFPNGTGVPTYQSSGGVASVARGATGSFDITLRDRHYKVTKFSATYVTSATNEDIYAQGVSVANLGAGTSVVATVQLKTGTSNVDVSSSADKYISVSLIFEESNVLIG